MQACLFDDESNFLLRSRGLIQVGLQTAYRHSLLRAITAFVVLTQLLQFKIALMIVTEEEWESRLDRSELVSLVCLSPWHVRIGMHMFVQKICLRLWACVTQKLPNRHRRARWSSSSHVRLLS